jgi:hypothetical protein
MATANLYILAKAAESDQGRKERNRFATEQPSFTRPTAEAEPEARLWKICAEAASPRLTGFEWVAFLFFGALAIGALAYSFYEPFHLLNSGALDQTVRTLLTR